MQKEDHKTAVESPLRIESIRIESIEERMESIRIESIEELLRERGFFDTLSLEELNGTAKNDAVLVS
ncbi:MAG TPA: hypothetical protein VLV49_17110 [Terriglobales bacterium]|nr:hypothetical protein [Terriglobales bacterium]